MDIAQISAACGMGAPAVLDRRRPGGRCRPGAAGVGYALYTWLDSGYRPQTRVPVLAARRHHDYDANVSSTNATVNIDHSSSVPLHEQVAAAIRRAIAEGEAQSGERLPPARDLAAVLGINANTVFRALRTLRDEGLVEFRRGRGVSVTGIAQQRGVVVAKARELVMVARRYGYRPEDLAEIIQQVS
jgi:GntR family transcriptional regulator